MSMSDPWGVGPHNAPIVRTKSSPSTELTPCSLSAAVNESNDTFPASAASTALLHEIMQADSRLVAASIWAAERPRRSGAKRSSRSAFRMAVRSELRVSHASASPLPGNSSSSDTW